MLTQLGHIWPHEDPPPKVSSLSKEVVLNCYAIVDERFIIANYSALRPRHKAVGLGSYFLVKYELRSRKGKLIKDTYPTLLCRIIE